MADTYNFSDKAASTVFREVPLYGAAGNGQISLYSSNKNNGLNHYRFITDMVIEANKAGASDIHLKAGSASKIRLDGSLVSVNNLTLTEEEMEYIAEALCDHSANSNAYKDLKKYGQKDLALTFTGADGHAVRCRLNIFRAKGAYCAAIRLLRNEIPYYKNIGLPELALSFPDLHEGIVLVTGVTGSGKSTTLAAILNEINRRRKCHIITLEEPIEYVYDDINSSVDQREIGADLSDFDDGVRAMLRQDPDVVLIGEMRDAKSIETAITVAQTGHLVFSTLHTKDAAETVDRLVGAFPADKQGQIRIDISNCLQAVLSQQLVPMAKGGRTLACEVMNVTPAISQMIRDNKAVNIRQQLETDRKHGSVPMDKYLVELYRNGKITRDTAVKYAHDRKEINKYLI